MQGPISSYKIILFPPPSGSVWRFFRAPPPQNLPLSVALTLYLPSIILSRNYSHQFDKGYPQPYSKCSTCTKMPRPTKCYWYSPLIINCNIFVQIPNSQRHQDFIILLPPKYKTQNSDWMLNLLHVPNDHTTVHFLLLYFHCPAFLLALPLPEGRAGCSREIPQH